MSDIKEWLMVDATEEFNKYFNKIGKRDWNKIRGNGFVTPTYFRYIETGEYYEYWPAFCAADEKQSWLKFASNFESAVKKLNMD